MVPDYEAGINEGLWEKLAPVLDLVILNMAPDHFALTSLWLTELMMLIQRDSLESHPFLFIFLLLPPWVGSLVLSYVPVLLTFPIFYSLLFSWLFFCYFVPLFTHQSPLSPDIPIFFSTFPGHWDRSPHWCNAGNQAWSMDRSRRTTEGTLTEGTGEGPSSLWKFWKKESS